MELLAAPYPITASPLGYFRSVGDELGIKGDLIQLILTNPGERVMLPQYGTPLRRLLFEQNTDAVKASASEMILNSIAKWEPRILVKKLDISTPADKGQDGLSFLSLSKSEPVDQQLHSNQNTLLIKLQYSLFSNLKDIIYLNLEVPLIGEANA
jgi:phage baseplate assembly protein W